MYPFQNLEDKLTKLSLSERLSFIQNILEVTTNSIEFEGTAHRLVLPKSPFEPQADYESNIVYRSKSN